MDVTSLGRTDAWAGVRAVVVGFDADGQAAADNLLYLGATVEVLDPVASPHTREFSDLLSVLGASFHLSSDELGDDPAVDLVITTAVSADAGVDAVVARHPAATVMSALDLARHFEPEQAWILVGAASDEDGAAQRIAQGAVTLLRAGGVNAALGGTGGRPALELVMEPERYDALVVVVTPEVLARSAALRPQSACVLVDVPGLAAAYTDVERACVYKPAVAATEDMVAQADVIEGARAIGITLGTPAPGMLGVVEDVVCDRAFVADRRNSAAELCTLDALSDSSEEAVENLLASVALARAYGVALPEIRAVISETF